MNEDEERATLSMLAMWKNMSILARKAAVVRGVRPWKGFTMSNLAHLVVWNIDCRAALDGHVEHLREERGGLLGLP